MILELYKAKSETSKLENVKIIGQSAKWMLDILGGLFGRKKLEKETTKLIMIKNQ